MQKINRRNILRRKFPDLRYSLGLFNHKWEKGLRCYFAKLQDFAYNESTHLPVLHSLSSFAALCPKWSHAGNFTLLLLMILLLSFCSAWWLGKFTLDETYHISGKIAWWRIKTWWFGSRGLNRQIKLHQNLAPGDIWRLCWAHHQIKFCQYF